MSLGTHWICGTIGESQPLCFLIQPEWHNIIPSSLRCTKCSACKQFKGPISSPAWTSRLSCVHFQGPDTPKSKLLLRRVLCTCWKEGSACSGEAHEKLGMATKEHQGPDIFGMIASSARDIRKWSLTVLKLGMNCSASANDQCVGKGSCDMYGHTVHDM